MERILVYVLIDKERTYQDTTYNPLQILSSGQTQEQRDQDVAPGLVLLDSYVRKAQDAWTNQKGGGSLAALQQVAKIAAIAVRILERASGSEVLLQKGLR